MSLGRILIFFGVILGLTLGTHYYLWARLIRDPMWPSPWRQLATVALIVLALSIPASMLAWRTLPRQVAIPVSWVGYVWMGSMFLLLVLLWAVSSRAGAGSSMQASLRSTAGAESFSLSSLPAALVRLGSHCRAGVSGRRFGRSR